MFHVVLVAPEIPPNTGNVIRLCANTGTALHLVEPLGFTLDDRQLKRAGLDYHEYTRLQVHADWDSFVQAVQPRRRFAMTTRSAVPFASVRFEPGDAFVFGSETRGLDDAVLEQFAPADRIRLPMREGSRSLNLSNAVAVTVYEAWRQNGFTGGV
ncbi:tRNA (uridine(34)/cytosine(34)/5-carboxymethylaminomethyluridine(34)-2'-O)-methyltransferase TrmL [soil metagenome]